jgi:hypothetical protein
VGRFGRESHRLNLKRGRGIRASYF